MDLDTKRGLLADYRQGRPLSEEQAAEAARRVLAAPQLADAEDRAKERREIGRLIRFAGEIPTLQDAARRLHAELEQFHSGAVTGRPEKVIVFTEYRDTHKYLLEFLQAHDYLHRVATLTGGMSRRTRQLENFAEAPTMLLLATDAASEGLDLQDHCGTIFHYEPSRGTRTG